MWDWRQIGRSPKYVYATRGRPGARSLLSSYVVIDGR